MESGKRVRAQLTQDAFIEDTRPPKRGRGRPPGALGKLTRANVEHAKATGEMPHHFLLRVARGEIIEQKVMNSLTGELTTIYVAPDFSIRIDAAKSCAPYFAPKLAAIEQMQAVSDDELNDIIRTAGSACGLAISALGEGEAGGDQEGDPGEAEDSWI